MPSMCGMMQYSTAFLVLVVLLYIGSGIDVSGFQNAEIVMTRLISMKCFFSSVDLIFRVAIVTPFPDFNKSGGRCIEFEIPRDIYWIDIH
jgi:hypothetical protein